MEKIIKKAMAGILAVCMVLSAAATGAEENEKKLPTTNEELESYTTIKFNPFFTQFNLTTAENVRNDYHGGEGYQCVYSLVVNPQNPDIMIYGNDTAGTQYTTDGGKLWKLSETIIPGPVCGLDFYPESESIAFALVTSAGSKKAGVYRSLDAGKTWERVTYLYNNYKYFNQGAISVGGKKDAETGNYPVYAISSGSDTARYPYYAGDEKKRGLYKSTDIGDTWELIAFEGMAIRSVFCDNESDTIIVVPSDGTIQVSYDAGRTWEQKTNGFDAKEGARVVAMDTYNKDHWVAASNKRGTEDGDDSRDLASSKKYNILYESYDGGNTWTHLQTDWGDGGISTSCNVPWLKFSYQKTEDGQTLLYAGTNENCWVDRVSRDGGKTFSQIERDLTNIPEPNSTGWYATPFSFTKDVTAIGRHQCMTFNEERQLFELRASGISGGLAMTHNFDKDGNLRYIGLMDVGVIRCGNYTDENEDFAWYDGDFPLTYNQENYAWGSGGRSNGHFAVDPRDENHAFAIAGAAPYGQNSAIVETFDGFRTSHVYQGMYEWQANELKEGRGLPLASWVKYNASNPDIVYSNYFVSYNNGKHWQRTQYQIWDSANIDGDICYSIVGGHKLYISTDCAKTWKDTGFYFDYPYNNSKLKVDLFDDYVVWVGNHSKSLVYRVDIKAGKMDTFGPDNGLCGDETFAEPENLQMSRVSQDPNNRDHLIVIGTDFYAGAEGHLFETYDGGQNWTRLKERPISTGYPTFHPTKPIVYCGGAAGTWVYNFEVKQKLDKDYFLDIDESPYKEEIRAVAQKEIIKYDINGNFYPTEKLTKAKAAYMYVNAKGEKPGASAMKFSDLSSHDDMFKYAAYAVSKGYMTAGGDKFNPDEEITFGQLAEYLAKLTGVETDDAYAHFAELGAVKDEFGKDETATNEEAAYVFFKAFNLEYIK